MGRARSDLRRELEAWGLGNLAEPAALVLSELFSNALLHARVPRGRLIETRYERTHEGVRIEVHDADDAWPQLQKAATEEASGRGLALVDAITGSRWGVSEREGVGKRVWALITDETAMGGPE